MSTGLECEIVERKPGEWYYILERWDSPKGGWDWHDYAEAYGPFATEDEAITNLGENHANPGGWMSWSMKPDGSDEDGSYTRLFAEATVPRRYPNYGFSFGRRLW